MAITRSLPPGPAPDLEELRRLEQQPAMLEDFRAAYGDLFTLHRPDQPPRVFLSAPAHFRSILLQHDQELVGLGTTLYNDLIGPRSMLKLAGAEHRRIRQIVTPPLVGASLRQRAGTVHRLIAQRLRDLRGRPPQPLARMTIGITNCGCTVSVSWAPTTSYGRARTGSTSRRLTRSRCTAAASDRRGRRPVGR